MQIGSYQIKLFHLIVTVLLLAGVIAAVIIVQIQQDVRSRASEEQLQNAVQATDNQGQTIQRGEDGAFETQSLDVNLEFDLDRLNQQ